MLLRPWAIAGQAYMLTNARKACIFDFQQQEQNDGTAFGIATPPSDISTLDCSLNPEEFLGKDIAKDMGYEMYLSQWQKSIATEKRSRLGWAVVVSQNLSLSHYVVINMC